MDKSKLELLNVCTDLKRAVMFLVRNNSSNECVFLKNIINNYPKLIKIDSNISKFIDINFLKNNQELPKIKAEHLLMQCVRLQNYLNG